MSKPRTGAIFTQDILHDVTRAMEMRQSSDEQADDVFRRKVHALQKFLQHGMSRFSVETLQHVLSSLAESDTEEMDAFLKISSLREVRHIVKRAIMTRESGSFRTSDVDSLHYMELFFFCVYCMSEAKRLFELLYEDLFYSYYDPDIISSQNTRTTTSASQNQDDASKRIDGLTEAQHYSQFGISTLDLMTGSTHHKLKQTVQDMKMILDRWTDLLTENDLSLQSFDPESGQDLIRLHGASGIEPVLRLIPDMFAKYYKCLELAKQWWVIAHEIYTGLPFQRRPSIADDSDKNSCGFSSVTLHDMSIEDENESTHYLDNETESDEVSSTLVLIDTLNDEIEVLERREEKFEVLTETYNKVGNDIERLQVKRNKLLIEQESIKAKGILEEIKKIEAQLNTNSNSIKLLEFQHALLFEDYVIHLELRPSIIRFLHDAKVQLNEAQTTLLTNQQDNSNSGQTDEQLSNPKDTKVNKQYMNISEPYHSEYSLQSIERGVQRVSDKCTELQQENTIMRARKDSLSKFNKRHSQQSLLKESNVANKTNKSLKSLTNKPDHDNKNDIKGTKSITKSPKSEASKTEPKAIKRNDKKAISPNIDHSKILNVSNKKRRSISEPNSVKKVDSVNHNANSDKSSIGQGKTIGSHHKSSDKPNSLKPVQEERAQKPQPSTKDKEQTDGNNNPIKELKTGSKQDGAVSKSKNPSLRKLSDNKISSGVQNASTSGKENATKSKLRPQPPMSTQMDKNHTRAK